MLLSSRLRGMTTATFLFRSFLNICFSFLFPFYLFLASISILYIFRMVEDAGSVERPTVVSMRICKFIGDYIARLIVEIN